jgi:hypothetical protein
VTTYLSSGQGPGTQPKLAKHGACFCSPCTNYLSFTSVAIQCLLLAGNKSRYIKFHCEHWRSVAVQFVSEPEICHSAGFYFRAYARVRVQLALQICHEWRNKSKKCDKQLTHIVRVMLMPFILMKLTYIYLRQFHLSLHLHILYGKEHILPM